MYINIIMCPTRTPNSKIIITKNPVGFVGQAIMALKDMQYQHIQHEVNDLNGVDPQEMADGKGADFYLSAKHAFINTEQRLLRHRPHPR